MNVHESSAESAFGAMSEAKLGGGNLIKVIGAGVKALIGQLGTLGEQGITLAILAAYDRLIAGDGPLPGDGSADSFEGQVEATGRAAVPFLVKYALSLLS